MAKFSKVKTSASAVAKTEAVKAEKSVIENILIENLVYDENNNEDITVTEDLELSIKEHGFLDPIIVTEFGMENGKYRIVSGHRRTEAMKKLKKLAIPALVQKFNSEEEVCEARQRFNLASRDTAKDPMLYVRRWMMWDSTHSNLSEGEKDKTFMQSSGVSISQLRRYKAVARLNPMLHDFLNEEYDVGLSSLVPLSPLSDEQQIEFCSIMKEAFSESREFLNRDNLDCMIKAFKKGLTDWNSIKEHVFSVLNNEPKEEISHGEKSTIVGDDDTSTEISDSSESTTIPDNHEISNGENVESVDVSDTEAENRKSDSETIKIEKSTEKLSEMLNNKSLSKVSDAKKTVISLMNLAQLIISNCNDYISTIESDDEVTKVKNALKQMIDNM